MKRKRASRAATAKHNAMGKEPRELRGLVWELLELTITDRLSVVVRKQLTEIVPLLQCYLRAAEEPPRSDLDAKGLKAQVLG